MRDYRFDVARVVCMTYIVAFMHLYAYVYPEGRDTYYIYACVAFVDACLGLFTFISGYLLGKKYLFGEQGSCSLWLFYKKRILRIIPLYFLSLLALWLIGFNEGRPTISGMLCISPFVWARPRTLWYIPVILCCYLITPLVSRKGLAWRIYSSLCVLLLLIGSTFIFPSIDHRLLFNVFFYLVGIVTASCFDWTFKFSYGNIIKKAIILSFLILLIGGLFTPLYAHSLYKEMVKCVGVFAILFLSESICSFVFGKIKKIGQLFIYVSYASMACYMFHRFFYWVAESVWNQSDTTIKWIYMAGLVYPVMLVISYAIQKTYDYLTRRL